MPYISMRKARLHSYIKKNSVFVFSILVALFMDRALLLSILPDGAQKYFGKKNITTFGTSLKFLSVLVALLRLSLNAVIVLMTNGLKLLNDVL